MGFVKWYRSTLGEEGQVKTSLPYLLEFYFDFTIIWKHKKQ